jgi:hypothetical protein
MLWCAVEIVASRQFEFAAIAVALLVGLGSGLVLGAAISLLPAGPIGRGLLLLPVPLLYASALVWAAGRSVRILVPFLPLLGVALAIVIGVAAGTGVHALCRRRAVPWLSSRGARLAAPLLAGAAGTLGGLWLAALDLVSVMQVAVCVGIAGGYALFISGWRAHPLCTLGALAAGAASTYVPEIYVDLQRVLASLVIGVSILAGAAWPRTPPEARSRRFRITCRLAAMVAGVIILLEADALLAERPGPWQGVRGGVASTLMRAGRDLTDIDGDGYGIVFGQNDCAPFDAAAAPGAVEIPGNGIDDNCALGDASVPIATWQQEADALIEKPPAWSGDIVMVLVDALRFDAVTAADLPALADLIAEGAMFERAYATSTFTAESMPGIFAGRLPSSLAYDWIGPFKGCPADMEGGLAAWLGARGYRTALAGVTLVDALGEPWECWEPYSLGHGFEVRRDAAYFASAAEVTAQAIQTWQRLGSDAPRFLYIHYMAVHNAVTPDGYRDEVRELAHALAALRDEIGTDTLLVLASDHGQAFHEHGIFGHAQNLYEETVRVPLIMAGPPITPGRVESVVSTRQIMPTLMAMVAPDATPAGRGPYLCVHESQRPCVDMPAPFELLRPGFHLRGLVSGHHKIIRDRATGSVVAYDLARDPEERTPLDSIPAPLMQTLRMLEEYTFSARGEPDVWPYSRE